MSTLYQYELESLLKILNVKDVLPPYITISHIRTFSEMCKYLIFPFMQLFVPGETDSASEVSIESSPKKTQIELWARAPGLLKQSVVIEFLGDECNLAVHYIEERNFRISITSLNKDHGVLN